MKRIGMMGDNQKELLHKRTYAWIADITNTT